MAGTSDMLHPHLTARPHRYKAKSMVKMDVMKRITGWAGGGGLRTQVSQPLAEFRTTLRFLQ